MAFLGIMGFNSYLNYQNYTFKREKEAERLQKIKEAEDKENAEKELVRLQTQALQEYSGKGDGSILKPENVNHLGMIEHPSISCKRCNSCKDCQSGEECLAMEPKLIFPDPVNVYLNNVLASLVD